MRRSLLVPLSVLLAFSAGCGQGSSERGSVETATAPTAGGTAASAAESAAARGEVYVVDPASSEVYWKISKAGLMARFGHNHVISAETFSGTVTLDPENLAGSRFDLEIPVGELVIDDPELRARFGEDFASVPSEDDKAGTRRNMLSEQLLKGDEYPYVRVRGSGPESAGVPGTLPVEIEIVGRTVSLELPGEVALGDGYVEASGEFSLEHADLGLTPFSALGGALQVGPTIEFSYRIRAVRPD